MKLCSERCPVLLRLAPSQKGQLVIVSKELYGLTSYEKNNKTLAFESSITYPRIYHYLEVK